MRKKLMAGNWKMYKTRSEAEETVKELINKVTLPLPDDREVLIIPPFTSLEVVRSLINNISGFFLGAQNFYPAEEGAFTGEISPNMILDMGCSFSLVGHSERRNYFNEDDSLINKKVKFGLKKGLNIILCIGENLTQRKEDKVFDVLKSQLINGLKDIDNVDIGKKLCVAYEPVWAIGTGEVARPKQIEEAHIIIRGLLKEIFDVEGEKVRILYGGSVKSENVKEIINIPNVDGVLVGGASLKAESFGKIIMA